MKRYLVILYLALAVILTGCVHNPSEDGVKCLADGKYEEAVTYFETAIEKEINPGDAYRGIGIAKWELEDYEGAAAAFENALKDHAEETGTIYNFLGNCAMQAGDMDAAINYFNKGLEAEDCSKEMKQEMRFNMIVAYEKKNDIESAKEKLAQYVADYPEDERAQKEAEFLETR